MAAAVAGYSHVAICVSDVETSRSFYTETLGLPEAPRPDFGFPGIWYQVGLLQLHLMEREVQGEAGPRTLARTSRSTCRRPSSRISWSRCAAPVAR
jgi:catechol 2,3-dioxygenase-like lactoylglutathione lyase family enzyme